MDQINQLLRNGEATINNVVATLRGEGYNVDYSRWSEQPTYDVDRTQRYDNGQPMYDVDRTQKRQYNGNGQPMYDVDRTQRYDNGQPMYDVDRTQKRQYNSQPMYDVDRTQKRQKYGGGSNANILNSREAQRLLANTAPEKVMVIVLEPNRNRRNVASWGGNY